MSASYSGIVIVSNANELKAAIASYKGDTTIVLKSGDYGTISINGKQSGSLTIVSQDSNKKAHLTLNIKNSSNITVKDVEIITPETKWASGLNVSNSKNITVDSSAFTGSSITSENQGRGATINSSSGIVLMGNTFSGMMRGSVITNSNDIKVGNNTVSHVRAEGFNFASVQNVEVFGNTGSDFSPIAGDHPDFIQFWTTGTTKPSENIYIHDNNFTQKSGIGAQGIFMDDDAKIGYKNVKIENNKIVSTFSNGILVQGADELVISGNIALASSDSNYALQIRAIDSNDVSITNNLSNSLSTLGSVVIKNYDNLISAKNSNSTSIVKQNGQNLFMQNIVGSSDGDKLKPVNANTSAYLNGFSGDDTISGGKDDDVIVGGTGNDLLTGGAGADQFVFSASDLIHGEKSIDKIFDLKFSEGDTVLLSGFSKSFGGGFASENVMLKSYSDIVDLIGGSNGSATAARKGTTDVLILSIKDGSSVEEINISAGWNDFNNAIIEHKIV